MRHDEIHFITAFEDVDILNNRLEVGFGSVPDDISSRSTTDGRAYVDCCTPRIGLLLAYLEFAKLDLCSPSVHAACRQAFYRCGLDQRAPSCR